MCIIVFTAMFSASHCAGQGNVVHYGANSNALNVVFVDTNLTLSAQSNIVADLRICLQEWGKGIELHLGGGYEPDSEAAGYLAHPDTNPYYPGGTMDFPRDVVDIPNGLALQISKALSDEYTNAFAFAAAHSNEIAAAYTFVAFVSSTNFPNIAPTNLPDYVLSKKKTSQEVVAEAQKIISQLGYQTYYPPSILGFRHSPAGPGEPNATNLWMCVPCSSIPSYTDSKNWGDFPAIWHEGKWKFSLWAAE